MIAIDLGSNTLRGIEIVCETKQFGKSFERMVKTADGLKQTGVISAEAVERIIDALKAMQEVLDFSMHEVAAKTTAAMRMASNSEDVLKQIYEATGVTFDIIDAKQEAYYTQIAVSNRLRDLELPDTYALLDVGGGSTELILFDGVLESMSIDVGIVTMSQSYTTQEALVERLYEELQAFKAFLEAKPRKPKMLVSTAGTPTTMASMKHGFTVQTYDPLVINGTTLTQEELEDQLQRLLQMNEQDRALTVGVGRDSLIVTGVEILKVLMDILDYDTMLVIDDGMREGIALDGCR